jgi:hypothetical protein
VHLSSGRAAAVPRRKSLGSLPQQAANHQPNPNGHTPREPSGRRRKESRSSSHKISRSRRRRRITAFSPPGLRRRCHPPPLKGRERERAMGGSPSRSRRSSSFPQQLQYGGYYDQGAQSSGYYAAPYQAAPPPAPRPRLDRRYSRIADDYNSVEQVRFAAVGCNCSSSARLNVSRVWISDLSYRRSTELIRSGWSPNCSSSLGFVWISKAIVNQPAIIRSCQWRLR